MEFNKVFKLFALPLALAVTHVNAATVNYYLEQSNDLLEGANCAQVTISNSATVVGDIDFSVEVLASAFAVNGFNFSMQNFSLSMAAF